MYAQAIKQNTTQINSINTSTINRMRLFRHLLLRQLFLYLFWLMYVTAFDLNFIHSSFLIFNETIEIDAWKAFIIFNCALMIQTNFLHNWEKGMQNVANNEHLNLNALKRRRTDCVNQGKRNHTIKPKCIVVYINICVFFACEQWARMDVHNSSCICVFVMFSRRFTKWHIWRGFCVTCEWTLHKRVRTLPVCDVCLLTAEFTNHSWFFAPRAPLHLFNDLIWTSGACSQTAV